MLNCTACIRRCIGIIFSDVLPPQKYSFNGLGLPPRLGEALYSTVKTRRNGDSKDVVTFKPKKTPGTRQNPEKPKVAGFTNDKTGHTDVVPGRKELEQELRWLKDPLKLADHVVSELRRGDSTKALQIVRMADKEKVKSVVSWNHLADYEIGKGHVSTALKIYNEVSQSLVGLQWVWD